MSKNIFIDALYPEETRVALCVNNTLEEFTCQSASKLPTKGNIYLGIVDRVEPSLQAVFVNYGNERYGFLPFLEIHPGFYQIAEEDKRDLLQSISEMRPNSGEFDEEEGNVLEEEVIGKGCDNIRRKRGGAFMAELCKRYKLGDVIKKGQTVLVQVSKEGRGTKGASLTTYITLTGRYCVLMPNAGGPDGVSRKIDDSEERERLKALAAELCSEGRGVIVRTVGAYKTKTEIRRDFEYLVQLWEGIKAHTSAVAPPVFVHEEADMIKKVIRDRYDSEVDRIVISGQEAYQTACDFVNRVLPWHIEKIELYEDKVPIFTKYGIEEQVGVLYERLVSLKSGGYLVIDQTEALVAVDVNSGRFTSEESIENTALRTNLEAVKEAVRQIKLRNLSGLVVMDFIDMEDPNNRMTVANAVRAAFSGDKARVQIGRMSEFGLLEMTRQRSGNSLLDASFVRCHCCNGRGRVRLMEATLLAILKAIRTELSMNSTAEKQNYVLNVAICSETALALLNTKKAELLDLEQEFGEDIRIATDERAGPDGFFLERKKALVKSSIEALSQIEDAPYGMEQENNLNRDLSSLPEDLSELKKQRGVNRNRKSAWKRKQQVGKLNHTSSRGMERRVKTSFLKKLWDKFVQ